MLFAVRRKAIQLCYTGVFVSTVLHLYGTHRFL